MAFTPQFLHQRSRARGISRFVEVLDYPQAQSISVRVFTPLPFAPCVETAALDPKHAAAVDNRVLLTQLVDQRERSLESRSRRALAFLDFDIPILLPNQRFEFFNSLLLRRDRFGSSRNLAGSLFAHLLNPTTKP
jgi:hypothetical protein